MSKYNYQVILDFENSTSPEVLAEQKRMSKKQGETIPLINYHNATPEELNETLGKLDQKSQLTITAHGSSDPNDDPGYHFHSNSHSQRSGSASWHYVDFARILADYIPQQNEIKPEGNRLMLNLIVCYAGMSRNDSALKSLAANLQKELTQHGIYVDIKARVTAVGTNGNTGEHFTPRFEKETQIEKFEKRQKKILNSLSNSSLNRSKKYELAKEYLKLSLQIKPNLIHKQPGSKLAFKWGKDSKDNPVQVAYDSYELKQHEACYQNFQNITQELREYARTRGKKSGYEKAIEAANTLANNIQEEADNYFKGSDKSEKRTEAFKTACRGHIKKANTVLGKQRDPLLIRILGKLTLAVVSVFVFPRFIHKYLIKKKAFSQRQISKRTASKKISDQTASIVDDAHAVKRFH